jgi:hypothetical protein
MRISVFPPSPKHAAQGHPADKWLATVMRPYVVAYGDSANEAANNARAKLIELANNTPADLCSLDGRYEQYDFQRQKNE